VSFFIKILSKIYIIMEKIIKKLQIGVIGYAGTEEYVSGGGPTMSTLDIAEKIGKLLAENNAIVVTGGKSGIMETAAKGAKTANGITVGVVKGKNRFTSNPFIDVEVITGMEADGMDEVMLVQMCDGFIVLGGGAGTLQEITLAYRNNKPVVALKNTGGWADKLADQYLDERNRVKVESASSPEESVTKILSLLNR
jgi:uncharacterized protein (TIGR00725 family)